MRYRRRPPITTACVPLMSVKRCALSGGRRPLRSHQHRSASGSRGRRPPLWLGGDQLGPSRVRRRRRRLLTIELLKNATSRTPPPERDPVLAAGQSERFAGVLDTLFGFSSAATLRLRGRQASSGDQHTTTNQPVPRSVHPCPRASGGAVQPAARLVNSLKLRASPKGSGRTWFRQHHRYDHHHRLSFVPRRQRAARQPSNCVRRVRRSARCSRSPRKGGRCCPVHRRRWTGIPRLRLGNRQPLG